MFVSVVVDFCSLKRHPELTFFKCPQDEIFGSTIWKQWENSQGSIIPFLLFFCHTFSELLHAWFILGTFYPVLLHTCLTLSEVTCFSWGKSFTAFQFQFSSYYLYKTFSNLFSLSNVSFLWKDIAYVNFFEIPLIATSVESLLSIMNFLSKLQDWQ